MSEMKIVKLSIPDRSCGGKGPSSPRLSSSSSPQFPFPESLQSLRFPPWTGWQGKEREACPCTWVRRSDHTRQPKTQTNPKLISHLNTTEVYRSRQKIEFDIVFLCSAGMPMTNFGVCPLACPFSIWPGQGFYIELFILIDAIPAD